MKFNFVKYLEDGQPVTRKRSPISDTWNNSTDWRTKTNASYENVYDNMFKQQGFDMDAYNDWLGQYYNLRRNSGYTGQGAVFSDLARAYQQTYHQKGFHTNEFQDGWEHVASAYTGDNFDANHKWGGGDDYYGATTHQRYANSWNADELARENEIAGRYGMEWVLDPRAEGLSTNDGRQFYKLSRKQTQPVQPVINEEEEEEPQVVQPQYEEEEEELPAPPQRAPYSPWTDWAPLTLQLNNDLLSALRQADYQKKMRFPLQEGPFLQHKITNNYHLRTGLQQNANDLRGIGTLRSGSSDLDADMTNLRQYDVHASQIENQAEQEKARKFNEEIQVAENVANQNKSTGAQVANANNQQHAAAWNNILKANAKYDLRRTEALNSYIGNMYTSHGEWVKDQRLNDQEYQRGLNEYNASLDQQKAYKDYYNLTQDYTKSQAYRDFAAAIDNNDDIEDFDSDRYNDDAQRDAYIKELWSGDSELAKQYRTQYDQEMTRAENQYFDRMQQISNRLKASNLMLPAIISNQGFYWPSRDISPTYSPLYQKQGGRARFIDYQNHIQKEQQHQKQLQQKRNESSNRKLKADLDRLSQEQMILLRSVFK